MFFSFPQCRLIIDPAGSVGPSGTGCDSDWKLVLGSAWLQPGPDTQLGGTPSVWSCLFPSWVRVRTLIRRLVRLRRLDMVHDELDHADAVDFMLIKLVSKLCALSEVHTTVVS